MKRKLDDNDNINNQENEKEFKRIKSKCSCNTLNKFNTYCSSSSCSCKKNGNGCTTSCKCKGTCCNGKNNDVLFFKVWRNKYLRRIITGDELTEKIQNKEKILKDIENRRIEITNELAKFNLPLRQDSKLCQAYILNGNDFNSYSFTDYQPDINDGNDQQQNQQHFTLKSIVKEMCIMKYLYDYCNLSYYWDQVKSSIFDGDDYTGRQFNYVYKDSKRNILETAKRYCILDHPLPKNDNWPWLNKSNNNNNVKKEVPTTTTSSSSTSSSSTSSSNVYKLSPVKVKQENNTTNSSQSIMPNISYPSFLKKTTTTTTTTAPPISITLKNENNNDVKPLSDNKVMSTSSSSSTTINTNKSPAKIKEENNNNSCNSFMPTISYPNFTPTKLFVNNNNNTTPSSSTTSVNTSTPTNIKKENNCDISVYNSNASYKSILPNISYPIKKEK